MSSIKFDPLLKEILGFDKKTKDSNISEFIKNRTRFACKPCWELKYCPYGPLVEQFPLLPFTREELVKDQKEKLRLLKKGQFDSGEKLTDDQKAIFTIHAFADNPDGSPKEIPNILKEWECQDFGHLCPVFFVSEEFSETTDIRKRGRYIDFTTKIRVVRRDNHTCQICEKHLKDSEVEFDHIIPISKGGSSEEHNIRLTCFLCNRGKSDKIKI